VTNLRVGVKVLQECIARAGSLEGGLRYYVGAANLPDDGGYAAKVLADFRLRQVAGRPAAATPSAVHQGPGGHRGRPNSQVCRRKSGPARQRRLNSRRWREAPSATLAGHATGDRRKAHRAALLTWRPAKTSRFCKPLGSVPRGTRQRLPCRDPPFAWAALDFKGL
jgi:hypothetical protein